MIVFDRSVDEVSPRLKEVFPRYACFVARPEEAGRDFVAQVHRLVPEAGRRPLRRRPLGASSPGSSPTMRSGSPGSATRSRSARSVVSGTEVALELCEQGSWYSELKRGRMVEKKKGETPKEGTAPSDTTSTFVESLNEGKVDLFITSGHATERDWQIGFGYRNGSFRSREGALLGRDTTGREIPVRSSNPKVYLAVGNCLMGHVDGKDAMALAWMHSGGRRPDGRLHRADLVRLRRLGLPRLLPGAARPVHPRRGVPGQSARADPPTRSLLGPGRFRSKRA